MLFKYLPQSSTWFEVQSGMKVLGTTKGGTGKAAAGRGGPKKPDNILQAPYSFKEGDLVCACEYIDGSGSSVASVVSRAADEYLQAAIEHEKELKKLQQRGDKGDWGKKKPRGQAAVEVALNIGGNLDFSDDDDEGDQEGGSR